MLDELISHIDEAYEWMCKQRKHFPADSDVWHLRFHWQLVKTELIKNLNYHQFYFEPLQIIHKKDGSVIHIWSAIDSIVLKALASQYIKRTIEYGGTFRTITRGISSGCPLSPLIAGFFLHDLDCALSNKQIVYYRYMDDIIVLPEKRWQLKRAIRCVKQHLARLRLDLRFDKTHIGKSHAPFQFLGYRFFNGKLRIVTKTHLNHIRRLTRHDF